MFFSIPDTTEVSAKNSSNQQAYTLFNIHINGIHHCSLRYSQLRTFNEELHRLLPTAMVQMESFPPKKLFSLSIKETDERRILLEHYLQSIVQNKLIITTSYFNEFFLNAQRDTFAMKSMGNEEKINFKINLLNKHQLTIENLSPNDSTIRLLDACASKIQLQEDFISYFALYFYVENKNQLDILRPLYDFESPYLSLQQTKKIHEQSCIVLKKSYWDSNFDLDLINDNRARKLLFVQAEYEIEQSESFYPSDIYRQLVVLRENNSFKEYVLLAQTSKFYGHIFLRQCSILFPIEDPAKQKLCQCLVTIGNSEIICCINEGAKKNLKEISFKVTRIRCWKVNRTKEGTNLAIEYLMKKDTLEWFTIHTEQAALVSTCLQSMVDEILAKRTDTTKTTEETPLKVSNGHGLVTRRESELERLNNIVFDRGEDDDDL
jgi:sorting nexin-17